MALAHSPSIVMNGLVLCLDAGNTKSYPVKNFVSSKIYSVFNGSLRSANYTVQYSDDNTNWTTAFSGVSSNNTSCGIQQNTGSGNGSYGFHRYWRYVEGSAVTLHHPRVSRIILTDVNGVDHDLVVYTSDNCSDSGTYIVGTVSLDFGGTTWSDLSGLGNTATMFGSVPFSTDIAPCFDFATATGAGAANSSLGFTFGSNMIPTIGNFTFSCWIKNPPSSSGQVGLFSNAGGGDGYRFGVGLNGIYYLIGPTYTEAGIGFLSNLSASLWYNVVAVYSRTTAQVLLYLNGIYQNASSIPSSQTAMQNGAPGLVRSACCGIYTGKLAGFSAYNRVLTAEEIQQNFNALRGRFGI